MSGPELTLARCRADILEVAACRAGAGELAQRARDADCILPPLGRALAQRPAVTSGERLQLVGVRPADRAQRLRNGMQLVTREAPAESLGYITSSTPSVELDGWVGLALLAGGRSRIGAPLIGTSPVHGERVVLEVVSPHMLDPENNRVRA